MSKTAKNAKSLQYNKVHSTGYKRCGRFYQREKLSSCGSRILLRLGRSVDQGANWLEEIYHVTSFGLNQFAMALSFSLVASVSAQYSEKGGSANLWLYEYKRVCTVINYENQIYCSQLGCMVQIRLLYENKTDQSPEVISMHKNGYL